jgi:two-component system, NtrC family, sensor kinase
MTSQTPPGDDRPPRVLLVDDSPTERAALRNLLQGEGFVIEEAAGGLQALALARARTPDVIITDVEMPDLNGLALVRMIRADPRYTRVGIVVLTSHAEEQHRLAGLDFGVDEYLAKPGRPREVKARIRNLLRLGRALSSLEETQTLLRSNEARFLTTLQSIGEGLISTDTQCRVALMNARAEQLTGWSTEEAAGRPIAEVLHLVSARTRGQVENPASRALREGVVVDLANDTVLVRRDHSERQIANSCAPIRDAGGRILGAVLVFRDVTEEQQRRDQLLESEERYRVLYESSRDAILTMVPRSWRFTSGNPAAVTMFGASDEAALLALGPDDISPPLQPDGQRSDEKARIATDTALRDGSTFLPWVYRRLGGGVFSADVLLSRIEMDGRPILRATVRDITERQRLEAELAHARKLEAVGQLAAGIAHEINTPAQFVGDSIQFVADGFSDVRKLIGRYRQAVDTLAAAPGHESVAQRMLEHEQAADWTYLEENIPPAIDRALDGVSRISTIVKAMKEFAHPDQREKCPADLNRALQATLIIAKNEYKYVADVETELGELPPVMCHLDDMNQVFLNLLVNAAHAIADVIGRGGGRGRILVRTEQEGDVVRIDVTDTGCGIPAEIRDRVFDPFFTTKEVGRGSGQGLTIARSVVVKKHGGTLTFQSEVGRGTTFTVRLPVGSAGETVQPPSE